MVKKILSIAMATVMAFGLTTTTDVTSWAAPAKPDSDTTETGSSKTGKTSTENKADQRSDLTRDPDIDFDAFSRPIEDRPHYVAIGDSYSVAGWGPVTFWEPCFRNAVDYPHMVSVATALPLVEPACIGGSGTGYWYSSKIKGTDVAVKVPYRKLINKDSTLVTINLGLNDIMLAYNKRLLRKCLAASFTNTDRLNHGACEEAVEKETRPLLNILPRVLEGIYKDAKKRAHKDALVVAVGYVNFFYGEAPCWDNLTIGPVDRAYIGSIFDSVNDAVKKAARKAKIPFYVPADHQIYLNSTCGVPGLRWTTTTGLPEITYPLHPTPAANAATTYHIAKMYWKHQQRLAGKR